MGWRPEIAVVIESSCCNVDVARQAPTDARLAQPAAASAPGAAPAFGTGTQQDAYAPEAKITTATAMARAIAQPSVRVSVTSSSSKAVRVDQGVRGLRSMRLRPRARSPNSPMSFDCSSLGRGEMASASSVSSNLHRRIVYGQRTSPSYSLLTKRITPIFRSTPGI